MLKRFLFFFLIIVTTTSSVAENKYEIIAIVNDISITRLDLSKELTIIKILNNKQSISQDEIYIGLNNLIEEKIKKIEIEKEKLTIDKKTINNLYYTLIQNLNLNNSNIDKITSNLIKDKIKVDKLWNELVAKKYSWKININMDEINKKILQNKESIKDVEETKNSLIIQEKNKKLGCLFKILFKSIKEKNTN